MKNILTKLKVTNFCSIRKQIELLKKSKNEKYTPTKLTHFDNMENDYRLLHDKYILSIKGEYRKDFSKVSQNILNLKEHLSKKENFNDFHEICYDIEKNVDSFKIEDLVKISSGFIDANLQNYPFLDFIQTKIGERLYSDLKITNKEDKNVTRILLGYFKNTTETSLMRVKNLEYILNYFNTHKYIFENENATNDFIWLTSLAVATHYYLKGLKINMFRYNDGVKNPLSETAAKNLIYILNRAGDRINSNHSDNTASKIRLYRALYYFKSEGLVLNEKLEKFLVDFRPFYLMNMEHKTTNSGLEDKFKGLLIEKNIKFTKEKKHDFCSFDYFVEPNVVFEVNGPTHYFDFMLKAKDIQKYRVLGLENYDVLEISYLALDNPQSIEGVKKRLDDVNKVIKNNDEIAAQVNVDTIREEFMNKQKRKVDAFVPNIAISEINH
jgi:hypothetical protein